MTSLHAALISPGLKCNHCSNAYDLWHKPVIINTCQKSACEACAKQFFEAKSSKDKPICPGCNSLDTHDFTYSPNPSIQEQVIQSGALCKLPHDPQTTHSMDPSPAPASVAVSTPEVRITAAICDSNSLRNLDTLILVDRLLTQKDLLTYAMSLDDFKVALNDSGDFVSSFCLENESIETCVIKFLVLPKPNEFRSFLVKLVAFLQEESIAQGTIRLELDNTDPSMSDLGLTGVVYALNHGLHCTFTNSTPPKSNIATLEISPLKIVHAAKASLPEYSSIKICSYAEMNAQRSTWENDVRNDGMIELFGHYTGASTDLKLAYVTTPQDFISLKADGKACGFAYTLKFGIVCTIKDLFIEPAHDMAPTYRRLLSEIVDEAASSQPWMIRFHLPQDGSRQAIKEKLTAAGVEKGYKNSIEQLNGQDVLIIMPD